MLRLALTDLLLTPLQSVLNFGALFLLSFTAAVVVFIGEYIVMAVDDVVMAQPAVVVARADNTPLPIEETVRRLKTVRGVLGAWPRIHSQMQNRRDGEADDIAVHVFHPLEIAAILPELNAALPWPVTLTTRADLEGALKTRIGHRLTLFLFLLMPGILALMLLTLSRYRSSQHEQFDIGVLKTLGWSSADILKRHGIQVMVLGGSALVSGLATAFITIQFVDLPVVQTFLLGPTRGSFAPTLTVESTLRAVFSVTIFVMTPFTGASLIPVARGVLLDPGLLLSRGR